MSVQSVAITSNVATLAVTILEGIAPIVNSLATIQGTQTTTSGGGSNFNLTNVAITGVSGFTTTPNFNTGTITFALTSNDITTTTDSGAVYVLVPEVPEAVTSSSKGAAFTMFSQAGLASNSRDVGWEVETPSAPSSFTAVLQGAMTNIDADYATIDTTTAVGPRTLLGVRMLYLRIAFTALSGGTNPSAVAKILV